MKMGWRLGRSIKDSHADSLYGMLFTDDLQKPVLLILCVVSKLFICLLGKYFSFQRKCGPLISVRTYEC
jgi:hypothetical protein